MIQHTILIQATPDKNGLKAHQDSFNKDILNITKFSINGRGTGLVMRFNTKTLKPLFDGSTWRTYRSYNHATIEDIASMLKTQLTK